MQIVPFTESFSTAYLLVEGDRAMLVDASMPAVAPKVLEHLGTTAARLRLIVLTHFHYDHVGAADEIRAATGAKVAVGRADAAALREGGRLELNPTGPFARVLARRIGTQDNAPVEPDLELDDGDDLTALGGFGRVVATPGHTPGSISVVLDDGTAFVGDALAESFVGHRASGPRFLDDRKASSESLARLAGQAKTVYVAHRGRLDQISFERYVGAHGVSPDTDILVPAPVQQMMDTTRARDTEGFVACFTPDAHIDDWGRTFDGEAGVRQWNASDNIGQGNDFTLTAAEERAGVWHLGFDARSRRRSGPGRLTITIEGDRIARMTIS